MKMILSVALFGSLMSVFTPRATGQVLPPPPGALLPVQSSQAQLEFLTMAVTETLSQAQCQPILSAPCAAILRYTRDPAPMAQLASYGPVSSTLCSSSPIDTSVFAYVQQLGQAAGFQEAYYFVTYDPQSLGGARIAFPISQIAGCCIAPYQVQLNSGLLTGSSTSTSPGSTVPLYLGNTQTPQTTSSIMVAMKPIAPASVGFGKLLIDPTSIVAIVPTGLHGDGQFNLDIPNNPALSGLVLYLQGAFVDPTPGSGEPKRLTNGLVLTIE